jgi:hypothetical protein
VFESLVGHAALAHHLHTFTACLSWHTRQSDTCCRALDLEDSFSIPLYDIRACMQLELARPGLGFGSAHDLLNLQ